MTEVPKLYETEPTPCDKKIIYQRYFLPTHEGFYWLIAELDPKEKLAFGYACLNDDEMAEWGYIPIQELEDVGAILDKDWIPCPFRQAIQRVRGSDLQ